MLWAIEYRSVVRQSTINVAFARRTEGETTSRLSRGITGMLAGMLLVEIGAFITVGPTISTRKSEDERESNLRFRVQSRPDIWRIQCLPVPRVLRTIVLSERKSQILWAEAYDLVETTRGFAVRFKHQVKPHDHGDNWQDREADANPYFDIYLLSITIWYSITRMRLFES